MKLNVALPRNPSLPWSVPRRDQWSGDAEMTLDSQDDGCQTDGERYTGCPRVPRRLLSASMEVVERRKKGGKERDFK
jgi:hypothetical protein